MPRFAAETFQNRDGTPKIVVIEPILEKFQYGYFNHWHVHTYEGNTAMPDYAKLALRETGFPVVAARKGRSFERLPESEAPTDGSAYEIRGDTLFIGLDRLPYRYSPSVYGHEWSKEFVTPYNQLQSWLSDFSGDFGLNPFEPFIHSPDPITAAKQFVFQNSSEPITKSLLRFALTKKSIWYDGFEQLKYGEMPVITEFDKPFDFSRLPAAVNEMGGWPDFLVESGNMAMNMGCDFTINGRDKKGRVKARINHAYSPFEMNRPQKRFMNAVFEAFGVS